MDLQHVDVVDLQALQRALDLVEDGSPTEPALVDILRQVLEIRAPGGADRAVHILRAQVEALLLLE
jgi:hypothetical protein